MTYTEQDLLDEMEYISKYDFMIMRYLTEHSPRYKTRIMQDLIAEFPDDIEHGVYLIPGKQYSDDIDEAITGLQNEGVIDDTGRGFKLTEYGRSLYDMFRTHPEAEIDEDLCEFIERITADADGMI